MNKETPRGVKVKPKAPGKRSKHTEAQLLLQMHLKELGLETELEFMFHSIRRWRFDLACLEHRIAFECNGHFQGKHGAGWSSDAEKINMAQVIGWRVFVFSNREVLNGQAKMWVKHNLTDVPMLSDALAIEALSGKEVPKSPANSLPSAATGSPERSSDGK